MFILRDLLRPLQAHFSVTDLGRERSALFAYTLLAVIVPFTSSMTSNLLRSLVTLFGIGIKKKRFYTFMASSTLPWQKLWQTVWGLIPSPETEGRLLVALDDCINPKIGKSIFACETIFDHAAKANQSPYPWAQNIVAAGLLKQVKGRWACLFLDFRFYLARKTITAAKNNAKIKGAVVPFQTKLAQAGQMLIGIGSHFATSPLLVVGIAGLATMVCGDRFGTYWEIDFISCPGCAAITSCLPSLTPRSLDSEAVAVSTVNAWDRSPAERPRFGKKPSLIPSISTVNAGMCVLMMRLSC